MKDQPPTQLSMPMLDASPDRWALVVIRINGDLEILSETRATRDEALSEAGKLAVWFQVAGVGIAPVFIALEKMEVIKKPVAEKQQAASPLEKAAEDSALRSLDGL